MAQGNLMKAGGLFAAALLLIGLIVLSVNRSGRMESQLFEELEEMTELDFELCPFDGRLTRTSRAVLFDFSDPLPAELADYPGKLMENMMAEMEDARRFDRFSLYTLNPFGNTPKALNAFCIPVTLKQIPSDIRRTLWGKDPEEHRTLPERYLRFAEVFERLWENERTLDASLQESMRMLESQSTSSQGYSRIIENLEEIVLSELDRNSREVKVTILSDMLQNSPEFSHYGSSWDFERYLASRRSEPFDMERVSFDVYFVQTCDSLESARRRALQGFWNDYFDHFNASADFKLLRISGDGCSGTNLAAQPPARQAQSPARQAQPPPSRRAPARSQGQQRSAAEDLLDELGLPLGGAGEAPRAARQAGGAIRDAAERVAEEKAEGTNYDELVGMLLDGRGGADAAPGGGGRATAVGNACPAPKQRNSPALVYPRRARGSADLRFNVDLDRRGVPVKFELYDMQLDSRRHERVFRQNAEAYIGKLRFDLQQDGSCTGGQTAKVRVQFR